MNLFLICHIHKDFFTFNNRFGGDFQFVGPG